MENEVKTNKINEAKTEPIEVKIEPVMVLAQVISYEQLEQTIKDQAKQTLRNSLNAIYSNTDIKPIDKFEQATKLMSDFNLDVSNKINNLERYLLYTNGEESFLVTLPAKIQSKPVTTVKSSNFVCPFKSGDKIRLEHEGKQSETYTYTLAGAQTISGEVIKFSKAVENFIFGTLGKPQYPNFKGFPGISHPYWKLVN